MNRLAGIIVAAVGFVICILSIARVLPGVTSTGVALIVLGGLIIGLSFIDRPVGEGVERMSTGGTLGNIFISPTEVFRNLRSHPRWLVAVVIMSILSATYMNLFLYRLGPEYVANYSIDKTLEMPLVAGNEEARKGVEAGRQEAIDNLSKPLNKAASAVSGFASTVFGYAFLALIFFLFALAMGGKLGWWQAFSATVYAALPFSVLRFILNTLVLFLKDPSDIHPILGQGSLIQDNLNFLVTPKNSPVIYTLLTSFSVLGFYWLWMQATGLKNTGEKVSGTIAWTSSISVYALMMLFGVAMALFFPSFFS